MKGGDLPPAQNQNAAICYGKDDAERRDSMGTDRRRHRARQYL